MLNQLNINQYMYNVYDEYTERYYINALNYSKNSGLIMRYFKILVDESYNFDSETSIQTDYKNFKYAIYDFVPIIDGQPQMTQSFFDPIQQGTSYITTMTITIGGIKNPLPGDMMHYYDISGNQEIDPTKIFRIKNVNYIRSINKKFPIYQIELETAPMTKDVLDWIEENNVLRNYYWNNETNKFLQDKQYDYYLSLINNREDYLNIINSLYNATKSSFQYCKLNSIFRIIQKKFEFNTKIIDPDTKFADLNLKDFMAKFSKFYKLQNQNPILDEEFPVNDLDQSLNDKINSIDFDDGIISLKDNNCYEDKEEEIFKIQKIQSDDNPDDQEIKYIKSNLFDFYDKLYKILFIYYMMDQENFWKDSIIAHQVNQEPTITDNGIFYDVNGEFVVYEDYIKSIKYNPGYAISYQNGAQYFDPVYISSSFQN